MLSEKDSIPCSLSWDEKEPTLPAAPPLSMLRKEVGFDLFMPSALAGLCCCGDMNALSRCAEMRSLSIETRSELVAGSTCNS